MFKRLLSIPPKVPPFPLFCFGTLYLSEQIRWLADKGLLDPIVYLQRHMRGDWGNVDEEMRLSNEAALENKEGLTSYFVINPQLALLVQTIEKGFITSIYLQGETPRT
ncbi:hypothetical protein [Pseudomonas chlororaphis]|uniref:hypothetical protein n=1 Tax=Pseudomonas chlororaphis TaxID=587753 RepID=UPI00047070F9|nr:hypothetical protein [Pseudomonas chlororaphis]